MCTQGSSLSCTECSNVFCVVHASSLSLIKQTCDGCLEPESDMEDPGMEEPMESMESMESMEPMEPMPMPKPKTKREVTPREASEDACSICLSVLSGPVVHLSCSRTHMFHTACIFAWFRTRTHRSCPLCRK